MIDLTQFAKTQFYAGKPDEASPSLLRWKDHESEMEVRSDANGNITAVMMSGNMEWQCALDKDSLKESIDAALEDACDLGRSANWSNDE